MVFVEDAIKQILSDDADVVEFVGNRIYPGVLQESTQYPAIAFRTVDADREPVLDSKTTAPPLTTFVFFAVAKDVVNGVAPRRLASQIDKALRHALQGNHGTVTIAGTSPAESVTVQGIFFVTASDTFDDRTKTYQYASVFDVRHSEEVPD